jgi:hypothetical protein
MTIRYSLNIDRANEFEQGFGNSQPESIGLSSVQYSNFLKGNLSITSDQFDKLEKSLQDCLVKEEMKEAVVTHNSK